MRAVIVIAASLMVAACTSHQPQGTTSVTPEFSTGGGEWSSGGGISVAVDLREQNGATVVCGAWTTDRQSVMSQDLNNDVMAVASVYGGNTRLVQNLSFMPRVPYARNLTGARANCVRTSESWRAEFAEAGPRVRIPRYVHGLPADDQGGNGSMVVFRETPRADIAY